MSRLNPFSTIAILALISGSFAHAADPSGVYATLERLPTGRLAAKVCERNQYFFEHCERVGKAEGYPAREIRESISCAQAAAKVGATASTITTVAGGLASWATIARAWMRSDANILENMKGSPIFTRREKLRILVNGSLNPISLGFGLAGAGAGYLVGHGVARATELPTNVGESASGQLQTEISYKDLKAQVSRSLSQVGSACPFDSAKFSDNDSKNLSTLIREASQPSATPAARAGDN